MRKLASIVTISTSEPIPETEKLDVTMMSGKGWRVVTGRGEFKPGDTAVYFEIDSALPTDDERYAFLHERCLKRWRDKRNNVLGECVRIRTIKLRGVISQGLIMPISKFPELEGKEEGTDVTADLRVQHYDELADAIAEQMAKAYNPNGKGRREGNFPSWIPKTDEERIQNLADYPTKFTNMEWEVTEKKDGSSMTVFWAPEMRPDKPFGVCSRNFELQEDDTNAWWEVTKKLDLENKTRRMSEYLNKELAIQGELIGPGMNGNRDNLPDREFRVFRIWNITDQCYIPSSQRVELCRMFEIPHVPVLAPAMKVFVAYPTVDDVLKFAEGLTENGREREGLVFKEANSEHPISFKAVSNRYLLAQK